MSFSTVFFGGGEAYDPDDDALGLPDASEATSLTTHVERCVMRYKQTRKAIFDLGHKQDRLLILVSVSVVLFSADKLGVLDKVLQLFGLVSH